MSTKYIVDNILVARETSTGTVVANPTLLQLCLTSNTLSEEFTYEEIRCLLMDTPTEVETTSEVTGSIGFTMNADTQNFILTHSLGEKISLVSATASVWAASTIMAVGNIVNVGTKYSLVVSSITGTGTTGTVAPAPTARGQRIVDGGVVWVSVPKLLKAIHLYNVNCPKFRLEVTYKQVGGSTTFKKQYGNLELGSLPIAVEGVGVYEMSIDPVGGVAYEQGDIGFTSLSSIAGAKTVLAENYFFGGESSLSNVLINGLVDDTDAVTITIDKGLSSVRLLNNRVRTNGELSAKGSITKEFTPEAYNAFKERSTFTLIATMKTRIGAYCSYYFPLVTAQRKDPSAETKTSVIIETNISAQQTPTAPLVTAELVFPSLVDSATGLIIGNGSW